LTGSDTKMARDERAISVLGTALAIAQPCEGARHSTQAK